MTLSSGNSAAPGALTRDRVSRWLVVLAAVVALFAAVLTPAVSAQAQTQTQEDDESPHAVAFSPTGTTVNPGEQITLDGSLSFDPQGSELQYRWTPEPEFSWLPLSGNGMEPTVTFFAPSDTYVRERGGVKRFDVTLTVTDDQGLSASHDVTFTFNPRPTFQDIRPLIEVVDANADMPGVQPRLATDTETPVEYEPLEVHTKLQVRILGSLNETPDPTADVNPLLGVDTDGVVGPAPMRGGDLLYPVNEGDTVRLRVQAEDADVTYRWEQIFGEGRPAQLVADESSVTFVAPKVAKTDPNTESVQGQFDDMAVMVTITDAHGARNFLRFALRVQEVDESPVADAGPNQEGSLPLDVNPTELEDVNPTTTPPEKIRVRLDATDTTDPDPYDRPLDVLDERGTVERERTVDYVWSVVSVENIDGVSTDDPEPDEGDDDHEAWHALNDFFTEAEFRFEVQQPDGTFAPATPAPQSAPATRPPTGRTHSEGTTIEALAQSYAAEQTDLTEAELVTLLESLEADLMDSSTASDRMALTAAVNAATTESGVLANDVRMVYTMWRADQLYPSCADNPPAPSLGNPQCTSPNTAEFWERDACTDQINVCPLRTTGRVELGYYEAVIEILESHRRRGIRHPNRGYGISSSTTAADVNRWFAQRMLQTEPMFYTYTFFGQTEGEGMPTGVHRPDPPMGEPDTSFAILLGWTSGTALQNFQIGIPVTLYNRQASYNRFVTDDALLNELAGYIQPTITGHENIWYIWDAEGDVNAYVTANSLQDPIATTPMSTATARTDVRSFYHEIVLPRSRNTAIETAFDSTRTEFTPPDPAPEPMPEPEPEPEPDPVDAGPVVYLVTPAACDTNGDGVCMTSGSAADARPEDHPLLGGTILVEVSTTSNGGAPADTDRVKVWVSEDPNARPEAEGDVRNTVGRLSTELQTFEGQPVVLSAVQTGDDNDNDPDFDGLTYTWTQTRPRPETALGDPVNLRDGDPSNDVCANCVFGADSGGSRTTTQAESEVVFSGDVTGLSAVPEGRRPRRARFEFALRVQDQWGAYDTAVSAAERVRVIVVEVNEPPVVDIGDDVDVDDGEPVTLTAVATDPDLAPDDSDESHTYAWTQTAGPRVELDDADTASVSFVAENVAGATLEFTVTVTDARGLSATDSVTVTVAGESGPGPDFYTGMITGPDYCTNLSLGGPRTFAFDSDGDGVADVCSLRTTREAAVERQNALEAQAAANPDRYAELVTAACAEVSAEITGDPEDVCATDELGAAPVALSAEEAPELYSGIITGPDYCTDLSLGGPRTFAFDSDGDGVAEVCSLPWSRREAVARQTALETLDTELNN